jgi:hypothetical protein
MRLTPIFALLVALCGAQEVSGAPHAFLDRKNIALFSTNAGLVAADAFTTDHIVNHYANGHEANPIARPFVEHTNSAKAATFWAGTYAGSLGLSYLLHHTGHHRMERFTQYLVLGCETYSVASNVVTDNRSGR